MIKHNEVNREREQREILQDQSNDADVANKPETAACTK